MTHEPQSSDHPDAAQGHDSVELPRPTVAPMVLSLGMVLLASGLALGPVFLYVGGVLLVTGLGMWISEMLPGRGHCHEPFVEPALRPQAVTGELGGVQRLREGMPGYRLRMPEEVHPISAGIKGGIVGGLVMPLPALVYVLLTGHSIWYPVNLLAGMVVPGIDPGSLETFSAGHLAVGLFIHVLTALIMGMIYGVLLPMLPEIPQAMAWGALLAPLVWTGATYTMMGIVSPDLRAGVSWPWFLLSQFIYGVAMALVVTQATDLKPVVRGLAGGALGGLLMPLPAILWALGTDRGIWYPINLLAGMLESGLNDHNSPQLRQFHANWFVMGLVMHVVLSLGFGVACALLLPKMRSIPGPLAWGGLLMPMLWTGASYSLMGVVNPLLQQRVDWPSFIASQFVFGIAAAIVVVRSEMVYITPAGRGPDHIPVTAKGATTVRREAEPRREGEANR